MQSQHTPIKILDFETNFDPKSLYGSKMLVHAFLNVKRLVVLYLRFLEWMLNGDTCCVCHTLSLHCKKIDFDINNIVWPHFMNKHSSEMVVV